MKKLMEFIKCVLFVVPIIGICIYARVNILKYGDEEVPYYLWNKKICSETQDKYYDVLIIGDSCANASYAPEVLSDSVLNLALGGTTPVENYYVLKEYLDNNLAPKVVYMSFGDWHLKEEGSFYTRILYTHRFSLSELIEIMERAKYYNEQSIITDTYIEDFVSYEFSLPNIYLKSIIDGNINRLPIANINAFNLCDLHKGRYGSNNVAENSNTDIATYVAFKITPLFEDYYKKIIELCEDNDIVIRIVKLPKDENVEYTENYENDFYTYYDQLKIEYPNLTVDWIKGGYGHYYFADNDHANNRGARKFSEIIKELYPDDFSYNIADSQYDIFDYDIMLETDFGELFQWIRNKEYTILIYDGIGELENLYKEEMFSDNELIIRSYGDNIYFVSGENEESLNYDLTYSDGYCMVTASNGTVYDWYPLTQNGIGVCIMNDRNQSKVCTKKFVWNSQRLTIEK
jgi:hypothetical protein